jgi:hypothetical protein
MCFGEVGARGDRFSCLAQHDRDSWELRFEHGRDDLDLGADLVLGQRAALEHDIPVQILDTSHLKIPTSTLNAATRPSNFRVDTRWICASITTTYKRQVDAPRRRRQRGENDPA